MLKKKSYTVICRGKNSYRAKSSIPPPHISLMVNHLEGGRRNGFDTSVNVIHQQMAGARSSCGGFQDQSFAFQDWKYADKIHKSKEQVQKNALFPFWGQTKGFRHEIVFRAILRILHGGLERLACFVPTKAVRFLKELEVHSVLYAQEKYVFKREFLYL